MNSIFKSECGRPVLEVEYDPELLNWDEAIRAALASHGFKPGQVKVIASPKKKLAEFPGGGIFAILSSPSGVVQPTVTTTSKQRGTSSGSFPVQSGAVEDI